MANVIAEDLKIISALGVRQAFAESYFNENPDRQKEHFPFDISGIEYWVISRLYWNPELNVNTLRDEYLKRTFRQAFTPMKRFYDMLVKSWYSSNKSSTYLDTPLKSADYYIIQAGLEKPCRDALEEAEKLAQHPESIRQIAAVRNVFEYWMAEAPKMRIPEITVPPIKAVAELDKLPWQINSLNKIMTSTPSSFKTHIKMAHDMKNLFVSFLCENQYMDTINGLKNADAPDTWPSGEHVEFFLDGALGRKAQYYFYAFNVFGIKYEGIGTDSEWNGKWDLKVDRKKDCWTALMTIPQDTIGVNVTQLNRLNGTFYKQTNTGKINEGASWGGAGLHAPSGFGQFILTLD